MLGKDGYKDTLAIVSKMNADNIFWKREVAVYDYLLFALSHISGNESRANRIIEDMLANDLVPREETMKAAILCAARSGDLEACSRYIRRMHEEWNLTISERMKAILLYACAKRGDFEGALEILGQLGRAGTLVHSEQRPVRSTMATATTQMAKKEVEKLLRERDVVDNSNVLMALINQTHARRGHGQQLTQEYVKEEVSKVLELFTVMTRDSKQVDTQLYTIMMQYLSTLPSPLPGMIYLYREMHSSEKAKPNYVTYRIMLEACAEHMDMDLAKQLWKDMEAARIVKDCRVRASFVKGWGRTGHLKTAERYTQEGMIAQRAIEKERIQYQVGFVVRNKRRREQGLPILEKMPRLPRRQRITGEMIDLGVLHELMRANRQHNQPERVYELYREIDAGEWGRKIRPNEFTLSIVLGACASGTTATELVDRGIELMDGYFNHQRYGFSGHTAPDGSAPDEMPDRVLDHGHGSDNGDDDEDKSEAGRDRQLELLGSETMPRKHFAPGEGGVKTRLLSDVNYQLYFAMLGRHHRQRKMVEVWDEMMETVEKPPSHLTVSLVTEALENVQWGAGPIKRLQRQLREKWPKVDWDGAKRGKRLGGASGAGGGEGEEGYEDDSVGAGGRFWK
ncbi:hypothetical protein BC939DRAFT_210870 [Gamsiella multidivaricata]|uniref:uncharacterized protein n=1 Tax=Gamsiella multidivaricata TaxID=101098 RepID=UPI00221F7A12|nr:uncharacterized protein BC939DRAFT_210870 [Gamsiella multidivaricata]KAI7821247.1 hypothetical protein BC939DRAFT_210870 [Gamsiella multidivaricata]